MESTVTVVGFTSCQIIFLNASCCSTLGDYNWPGDDNWCQDNEETCEGYKKFLKIPEYDKINAQLMNIDEDVLLSTVERVEMSCRE